MNTTDTKTLIANLYGFKNLSKDEQKDTLAALANALNNGTLGWPEHRNRYLFQFFCCLAGLNISKEDADILDEVDYSLSNIRTVEELDTCHLYWLITRDLSYLGIIRSIANDPFSNLRSQASTIVHNAIVK